MGRFSLTARCVICNKEIAQSGPARQWVHQDGFYSKADHPAEPGGRQPYLMPKKAAPDVDKPAKEPKKKSGATSKSDADLRRRLRQGSAAAVDTDDAAQRRRRVAALESKNASSAPTEADLIARKLRMLRETDTDQQK